MTVDEAGGVPMMYRGGTQETAVTVTNMEAAENLIRAEPRVTTLERIQESLSIGTAATVSIFHDHLRVRKRCTRWIPHSLTDEHRRGRGEWCEFMCCESSTEVVQN